MDDLRRVEAVRKAAAPDVNADHVLLGEHGEVRLVHDPAAVVGIPVPEAFVGATLVHADHDVVAGREPFVLRLQQRFVSAIAPAEEARQDDLRPLLTARLRHAARLHIRPKPGPARGRMTARFGPA